MLYSLAAAAKQICQHPIIIVIRIFANRKETGMTKPEQETSPELAEVKATMDLIQELRTGLVALARTLESATVCFQGMEVLDWETPSRLQSAKREVGLATCAEAYGLFVALQKDFDLLLQKTEKPDGDIAEPYKSGASNG